MFTKYLRTSLPAVLVVLVIGTAALMPAQAQDPQTAKGQVTVTREGSVFHVTSHEGTQPQGATFTWVGTEMSFESKVVKGMPFSADTITEFSQTLGNGQRIYRKNTGAIYRDSEGRTRKEQTIEAIGPYTPSGPAKQTILINDPVASVTYILDSANHTAMKTVHVQSGMTVYFASGAPGAASGVVGGTVSGGGLKAVDENKVMHIVGTTTEGGHATLDVKVHSSATARTESLGTQLIEGVSAEGKRTVETIPAGAIGNDSPIEIISESWYSPELGMVVKSRHNDPRSGENLYQLTNIRRGEPSPDLFQVPVDYTIKESQIKHEVREIKK